MAEARQQPAGDQYSTVPVTVAGRYKLGSLIGPGAGAEVYRGHDRLLDRAVVVKLFDEEGIGELSVPARLQHPGLITLYDVGIEHGRAYLVMELVDGAALAERLAAGGLPLETVASLGAALADTLAYLHDHDVIHLAVTPANVLLGEENRPLLSPFGAGWLAGASVPTTLCGGLETDSYAAPEQVRGETAGAPADVYSLGKVLLESVTGRREYAEPDVELAPTRGHRRPAVPVKLAGGLAPLLERMTADDPAERPSAAEVAESLARVAVEVDGTASGVAASWQMLATSAALPSLSAGSEDSGPEDVGSGNPGGSAAVKQPPSPAAERTAKPVRWLHAAAVTSAAAITVAAGVVGSWNLEESFDGPSTLVDSAAGPAPEPQTQPASPPMAAPGAAPRYDGDGSGGPSTGPGPRSSNGDDHAAADGNVGSDAESAGHDMSSGAPADDGSAAHAPDNGAGSAGAAPDDKRSSDDGSAGADGPPGAGDSSADSSAEGEGMAEDDGSHRAPPGLSRLAEVLRQLPEGLLERRDVPTVLGRTPPTEQPREGLGLPSPRLGGL